MMPGKERNTPIGDVECAHRSCDLKAKLYRYRKLAQQDGRSRFAGKLYSICERGHRCDDQEYLLEKGNVWGARKGDDEAPADAGKKTPARPVTRPVATPSSPVKKQPNKATPSPTGQQQRKKFGFWEW